jgi:putative copper export protein
MAGFVAFLGLALLFAASRRKFGGVSALVAAVLAMVLAIAPALTGHAIAAEANVVASVALDGAHVLAASAWLGTLAVVLVAVVLPAAAAGAAGSLIPLLSAFSPVALTSAGVLALSGVGSTLFRLARLEQLWTTPYGAMVAAKIALLLLVAAVGAYNWKRVTPRLATPAGTRQLARSATVELLIATVAILVTAVLTNTPPE